MSTSKAQILGNIRRGLSRDALNQTQQEPLKQRLRQPLRHTIPARSQLSHAEQVQLFVDMATEAAAEVHPLANLESLPAAVASFLSAEPKEQISHLVMAQTPELTELDWSPCAAVQIEHRVARAGDPASLTSSFAGIAETGTLMLHSQPNSPTTLNFLTDIHLVVLKRSRIVGPYEDAWQLLRQELAEIPRTVNMITGPSRSADIEQRLQMGAHGPKRLGIFLIED